MYRKLRSFISNRKLKWKMVAALLPLILLPIFIVVTVIGYISIKQVDRGITQTSKNDLDLLATYTSDLLDSYHQLSLDASGTSNGLHAVPNLDTPAFDKLKGKIKNKKVGKTGYIFCMDYQGNFLIHPFAEGQNFYEAKDLDGKHFIREMCQKKTGWIRYPWKNETDKEARMKIVRYTHFEPWNWIVAVGSYEDEFYEEANQIKLLTFISMLLLTFVTSMGSIVLLFFVARELTTPVNHMIEVIRKVKKGRLDEKMDVKSQDELGELAAAFNRMTGILKKNKELEETLSQQGKMASLGVLSSGVAHEINNPLGVILGYTSYVEGKISKDDPLFKYIHEIKRESKRCKKIVQDLLSYAKTPSPTLEQTDINELITQIVDFASNHTDMHHATISMELEPDLPPIMVDPDQLRQVAINLILNAGGAMEKGGRLIVKTELGEENHINLVFSDNGAGISEENLEKIFEPFFTTKARGTGLGLAITRQIIEQHQGKIFMESTIGKGTTVTVKLPIKQEEYHAL